MTGMLAPILSRVSRSWPKSAHARGCICPQPRFQRGDQVELPNGHRGEVQKHVSGFVEVRDRETGMHVMIGREVLKVAVGDSIADSSDELDPRDAARGRGLLPLRIVRAPMSPIKQRRAPGEAPRRL